MIILVQTYRRPALLGACLWKLADSWLPADAQLVVSHDGPMDPETEQVVSQAAEWFQQAKLRYGHMIWPERVGLGEHTKRTADRLGALTDVAGWIAYLEDDCLVSRLWWLVLDHIARQVPKQKRGMVVGYNHGRLRPHADQAGVPRHSIRYKQLNTFGLMETASWYRSLSVYRPGEAHPELGRVCGWDTSCCLDLARQDRWVLVPDRSVINHLGMEDRPELHLDPPGRHGSRNPVASDFVWC